MIIYTVLITQFEACFALHFYLITLSRDYSFCFKKFSELSLLQVFLFYGLTALPELWVPCGHDNLNIFKEILITLSTLSSMLSIVSSLNNFMKL